MKIPNGGQYGGITGLDSTPGASDPDVSGTSRTHGNMQEEQPERSEAGSALGQDWATLSTAGNQAVRAASESGVRQDKVDTVRAALSAGTYAVSATAVAASAIGAMLGQGM